MAVDPHLDVAVVGYDPKWRTRFAEQQRLLADALGSIEPPVLVIEHVGSTAVPGLDAKPIIDIMVTFESLPPLHTVAGPLATIGYEHVPKPEFTESHFFRRGATLEGTDHLHVTSVESEFGLQMLRFRDALRAVPELAADYAAFKRQLAEQFPHDRPSYTRAKGPFIAEALRRDG